MLGNLAVRRSKLIQAVIKTTTANSKYKFDQLQNNTLFNSTIKVYAIEVFTATQLITTPTGNNTVIAATAVPSITFTLIDNKTQKLLEDEPLYSLVRSLNGGFFILLDGIEISLQNSHITIVDSTNIVADTAVPFNLYYEFAKNV